jgi:hypothetical protein
MFLKCKSENYAGTVCELSDLAVQLSYEKNRNSKFRIEKYVGAVSETVNCNMQLFSCNHVRSVSNFRIKINIYELSDILS